MALLVLGVLLWSGVHLLPCALVQPRARLIARIGEPPYKGVFALTVVVSIVLMVLGWRSSAPVPLYSPPAWGASVANVAMLVALVLFAASALPTNLKRVLRHPQLTGFSTWAGAHLLSNGDARSLVLFGGLGLWGIVAILFINRRDGAWGKPAPLPMSAELKPIIAGVVFFAVLFFAHPYLFGVAPLPR